MSTVINVVSPIFIWIGWMWGIFNFAVNTANLIFGIKYLSLSLMLEDIKQNTNKSEK